MNQSKMNHKWKYSNLQYAKPNVWQDSFLVSSTHKTIKTRKYNCNELNTVQVTKCLDDKLKKLNDIVLRSKSTCLKNIEIFTFFI